MRNYFDGYYFKHQKGKHTLCVIAGYAGTENFIQIITNDFSVKVPFSKGNYFSEEGIKLNIQTPQISLSGSVRYQDITPIKYDIMGPFRFFPMECRHGIVSMYHRLEGSVLLNGQMIDFTNGVGYVEKDSGRSFPSSYVWVQANDFLKQNCSIMASVANIPFCGLCFQGCICVIYYKRREYRFATYLGVKVLLCTRNRILLKQGKYLLEIRIKDSYARKLRAPHKGKMTRVIREMAACPAEFILYKNNRCIFHLYSQYASVEYEF